MIVTLITDFGLSDPYVGSMKGVILGINPDVRIVDITHDVSPQNVNEAAFVLNRANSYFPEGTIHVVVVDPGVGGDRAVLAVETSRYTFLAPDNGVLKYIFDEYPESKVYRVTNHDYFLEPVSRTFHGRDIFAPVAAHLSKGVGLESMGELFSDFVRGEVHQPEVGPGNIVGEIITIDRFGNGITNIGEDLLSGRKVAQIHVRSWTIDGLSRTYSDGREGEPVALIGSGGTLEISVWLGSAGEKMGFSIDDPVTVDIMTDGALNG